MVLQIAWVCWVFPIIGAAITPFLPRKRGYKIGLIAVISIGAGLIIAISSLGLLMLHQISSIHVLSLPYLGVYLDLISLLFVTLTLGTALVVASFSVARSQQNLPMHYWVLLQLMAGALVFAVLSDNLLHLFAGWEIVSIAFSGIVAFKLNDSQKIKAGIKSFAVFRIGGGFLLIGILLIYTAAGTFNLIALAEDTTWMVTLNDNGTLLIAAICVLIGISTKLAQFPFHFWLPDATTAVPPEVNAFAKASLGIYLPVRLVPIFYAGIENGLTGLTIFFYSLTLIALVSGLIAAGLILIQQDVWKALAYYFMIQYARMLIGFGVSGISLNPSLGYTGAIVHLVTDSVVVVAFVLGLTVYQSISHRNSSTGSLKESLSTSKFSKYMKLILLVLIGLPPFCIFWSEETLTTAVWTLFLSALNRNQLPLAWFSGGIYFSMLIILALVSFGLLRISGLIEIHPNTSTLPALDETEKPAPVFLKGLALGSTVMIILISVITPLIILYLENATGTFFHLETHSVSIVVFIYTTLFSPAFLVTSSILVISAYPAYRWYIKRVTSPPRFVDHPSLVKLHTIIEKYNMEHLFTKGLNWINQGAEWLRYRFEDKIFHQLETKAVTKINQEASRVYNEIERHEIERLNIGLPLMLQRISNKIHWLVEGKIINRVHQAVVTGINRITQRFRKTHTGVLSYNLLAVMLAALIIIGSILIFGGFLF